MIRHADINDLASIAKVHSICFPDSLLSQFFDAKSLTGGLIGSFYKTYLEDAPEIFFVATDMNNDVIGFCMGYYMDNSTQMKRFIKNNRLKIILKSMKLILKGNTIFWQKIKERIKHKPSIKDWSIVNHTYENIGNDKIGDLLSVCLIPKFRGLGYAQQLMDRFLDSLSINGKKLCLLSVATDNKQAIKYYEKNNFELYRIRGNDGLTYMKLLK